MNNKTQTQKKRNKGEHYSIKLQKGPSKGNIMKPPNTNNNASPHKRMIKIDLKLQYLLNELNSNRKFKDYMQDLSMATKDVIVNSNHVEQNFVNSCKSENKKNSFSIVPQLEQIKQMISGKKNQILNHIQLIKKRMSNSSIWDDKIFYDFTESNYEEKMLQMQGMLQITQGNLQEKQKQKKNLSKENNNVLMTAKSIRYSLYDPNSEDGLMIDQNIEAKHKVLTELKRVNQLQTKLSTILEQKNELQRPNQKKNEKFIQNDHPFLQIIMMLKKEMRIIQAEISEKKKLIEWKDKLHQGSQISSNDPSIISQQIQVFTKEILTKELAKTKGKISMLKHQTSNLQNSIKELQGYKALLILRSKNEENTEVNKKSSFSQKKAFDDEILHQILQHQFLTKSLRLKVETRFCGLTKKDIHSFSDTSINQGMNYFCINNTCRKSTSEKKINRTSIQRQDIKDQKINSPGKKNKKLSLISTKSPKKKETGSSAETNS